MPLAFELRDVGFTYRGRELPALSSISAALAAGRILALSGHSGAGKTTLLSILAAVIPAVRRGLLTGKAALGEMELAGRRPADLAGKVALVVEDFDAALVATTVEEEVAFGPRYMGVPSSAIGVRVRKALAACGLQGLDRRRIETLSGGQKQRLALAAALATDARLFLLDEAATDLDPSGRQALEDIARALAAEGKTVVTADHDAAAALSADEVLLLGKGRTVRQGAPLEILADERDCEAAGVDAMPYLRYFKPAGRFFGPRPNIRVSRTISGLRSKSTPPSGSPLITANGLSYRYVNGVQALDGFNLEIAAGDMVAIIGLNGGGKTTFAKILAGLIKPDAGVLTIGGEAPWSLTPKRRARLVGYLFQNPDHQIFRPTVREEVIFGPRRLGLEAREVERRAEAALAAAGLTGLEGEDPFVLPKGDRQRVALASVLAMEPSILVMDEPTTGLDGREVAGLMAAVEALNQRGVTVIFITHTLDVVARHARRVAVVAGGRLAAHGTPREILLDDSILLPAGLPPPLATRLGRMLNLDVLTGAELGAALAAPFPKP